MGQRRRTVVLHKYAWNPYDGDHNKTMVPPSPLIETELPYGTIHSSLTGLVRFVPYPTEQFLSEPCYAPKEELVRIFWGQVPYHISDMQLSWIAHLFAFGTSVHYTERIMKKDPQSGRRLPRGCVHTYCAAADFEALQRFVNKRLLIDDTGVWYAADDIELESLNAYINRMKRGELPRPTDRPYDSVVIELAQSTYVPQQ